MPDVVGGTIKWYLDVDDRGFSSKMAQASASAKAAGSAIEKAGSGGAAKFSQSLQAGGQAAGTFLKVAGAAAVAVSGLGIAALKSASDYQQNRIAFDTMLGSVEKGQAMMKSLSQFAKSTPFDLPQVVTGAKQLLAYGIAGDQIIPTFRNLGNIAAGVGRDKLPQLVVALGQVRTAGHLTGMELRQFTEAGVPLLEELAKQSGKSAAQIKDDMERGIAPSFDDVQKALASMSGAGGKFFNLMEKQSKTLGGIASNIKDSIGRVARAIVGVDELGNVKDGSLFAIVSQQAEKLQNFLDQNEAKITATFSKIAGVIVMYGSEIAAVFAAMFAVWTAGKVAKIVEGIISIGKAYQSALLFMAANPITIAVGAALIAIGMVALKLYDLQKTVEDTNASLKASWEQIGAFQKKVNEMPAGPRKEETKRVLKESIDRQTAIDAEARSWEGFSGFTKGLGDVFANMGNGIATFTTKITAGSSILTTLTLTVYDTAIAAAKLGSMFGLVPDQAVADLERMKQGVSTKLQEIQLDAAMNSGLTVGQVLNNFSNLPPGVAQVLATLPANVKMPMDKAQLDALVAAELTKQGYIAELSKLPPGVQLAVKDLPAEVRKHLDVSRIASDKGAQAAVSFLGSLKSNLTSNFTVGMKLSSGETKTVGATIFSMGFAKGGFVPDYMASGGFAARGTDTVPAMLTPGEHVMSLKGIKTAGEFLETLNSGQIPRVEYGQEVADTGSRKAEVNIYAKQLTQADIDMGANRAQFKLGMALKGTS